MDKPWEFKTDEERSVDNIYTFLIFCEDETSEVEYFRWYETDAIKINIFPKQKSMITNVVKAISHCKDCSIIDENNDVVDGYEVWCVYDSDKNENAKDKFFLEDNQTFNIAHTVAESHKINLAWSNDAFELWIILHIMNIDNSDESYKSRKEYYKLLDNYFINHQNPNERLVRILEHKTFSYKKDLKHRKNFIEIVREGILPNTMTAIERAQDILEFYKTKNLPYDQWSPCTLVHLLVLRLLEKGGKILPVIE